MTTSDGQDSGFGRSVWIATGLLLIVPVAPILRYVVGAAPVWIFAAGAVAIAVLAGWIRRATEQAAKSLGPAIGGLLTVSFGSIAEIVLAMFVLAAGKAEVVKAQITGSILGTSLLVVGLAIVVGTVSDLFAAAWFARGDKMGLALNICVGSAIQVAMVVAPLLVVASWMLGKPVTLVFGDPLDLFAIAGTAFIVNAIASDSEATWFEGVLLIGVYVLLAMAFFFVSRPA